MDPYVTPEQSMIMNGNWGDGRGTRSEEPLLFTKGEVSGFSDLTTVALSDIEIETGRYAGEWDE